jgi:hypothetical protein
MLRDNRDEPLHTSKDSSVNDDWTCRWFIRAACRVLRGAVLEVEPLWQLEIELDSRALE